MTGKQCPLPETGAAEAPLESWKEISAYLQREERTARRWEKEEGLPVHRHHHLSRSSVYAYRSELDAWRAARVPRPEPKPLWRQPVPSLAMASVLLLAMITAGSGPYVGPVMAADGSGVVTRQVWLNAGGAIPWAPSPDGSYLSYMEARNLGVRDIKAGTQRLITTEGSRSAPAQRAYTPIWSPDGKQIAYTWQRGSEFEVRVLTLDNPKPRVLLRGDDVGWVYPQDWSPDGKQVLAILARKDGSNQFVLISAADGTERVVKTFPYGYFRVSKFSPDGRYIVYDSPSHSRSRPDWPARDLFVLAADGSVETPLVEHPADDFLLGWDPTGNWVLYASDRAGSLDLWAQQVADGRPQGIPRRVKQSVGRFEPLGFARNGSFYYLESGTATDIYAARIDMQTGKVLVPSEKAIKRSEGANLSPRYSPDGRSLAYTSKRGHPVFPTSFGNALSIHSLETGRERVFLEEFRDLGLQFIARPRWAPDSRSLLIFGRGRTDAIYRVDLVTGGVTSVLEFPRLASGLADHEWSRDGKSFFYVRLDENQRVARIVNRNLDSGEEREVYRVPTDVPTLSIAVSWDGRWLSFLNHAENVLGLIPASGGSAREIHRFEKGAYTWPEWTADGKHILVARVGNGKLPGVLARVPVEGGQPQELALEANFGWDRLSLNPDGQRIAFCASGASGGPDVWVMENFLPESKTAQ